MSKKDINIKNTLSVFAKILRLAQLKIELLLMLIFFLAVLLWGYIFYTYSYKPTQAIPDVNVLTVKIDENKLKNIINDLNNREKNRALIYEDESNIKNPFLKIEEADKNLTVKDLKIPTGIFQQP